MNNDLLLKYVKGETTEAEDAEVYVWIEAAPQNRSDFEQLQRVYQGLLCHEFTEKETKSNRHIYRSVVAAVIAVVAVSAFAVLGFGFGFRHAEPQFTAQIREIHVPAGQRSQITLDDGTTVWVNSGSTLICSNDLPGKRHVTVIGEAYLDVAPDSEHPFIVSTGGREIKVLGTKFDVRTDRSGRRLDVRLFSGNIEITDSLSNQSHSVTAGHKIEFSNDRAVLSGLSDYENFPLWIEGIYHFDNATFGEILDALTQRYGFTLKVDNPEVLGLKATCKFRMEDGLRHIVGSLQQIHSFKAQWNDNERILTIQ